ncbi:MAG: hypothetical protein PWP03_113 [Candidatus Woesearchaeota archaeon]|nr:hypothetical protein [Candidatus Woesearchaeota archaeon]
MKKKNQQIDAFNLPWWIYLLISFFIGTINNAQGPIAAIISGAFFTVILALAYNSLRKIWRNTRYKTFYKFLISVFVIFLLFILVWMLLYLAVYIGIHNTKELVMRENLTYFNEKYRFSLEYPSNWNLIGDKSLMNEALFEQTNNESFAEKSVENLVFQLILSSHNCSINLREYPVDMTNEEFTNISIEELKEMLSQNSSLESVEIMRDKIDDLPVFKVRFNQKLPILNSIEIKVLDFLFVRNNNLLELYVASPSAEFSNCSVEAERIIKSIKFS